MAAPLQKIRGVASMWVSCASQRSDAASWIKNAEDVPAPAGKGSAATAELCKGKEEMSKCVCMWKPVLQRFHTCLLEMMKA